MNVLDEMVNRFSSRNIESPHAVKIPSRQSRAAIADPGASGHFKSPAEMEFLSPDLRHPRTPLRRSRKMPVTSQHGSSRRGEELAPEHPYGDSDTIIRSPAGWVRARPSSSSLVLVHPLRARARARARFRPPDRARARARGRGTRTKTRTKTGGARERGRGDAPPRTPWTARVRRVCPEARPRRSRRLQGAGRWTTLRSAEPLRGRAVEEDRP